MCSTITVRHKYDGFFQFALKDGRPISIHDVQNGLSCDCVCPKCGERLIAYNNPSNERIAHFQHQSLRDCHGVYETSIHFLAKEVILEQGFLIVPDVHYSLDGYANGYDFEPNVREDIRSMRIHFDSIEVEKSVGSFRPDLKCTAQGKTIYIEIAVTHFVDEVKERKIHQNGFPLLEIDLSNEDRVTTKAQLSQILYYSVGKMKWINNPKIPNRLAKAQNEAKRITDFIQTHKKTLKVYGKKRSVYCPRFKIDVDKVNADDVCTRTCCCFVKEWESHPQMGDEPYIKTSQIECVGHVASEYFALLKAKGITVNERIHL